MNDSYPKISIVTVNYNKGQFIEETILSVINQNYPNLEYIIIDGASTDNSVEIIKKYENKLAYFISEPDKGMTDALIKGFNKASGDILAWINSDDKYCSNTFNIVAQLYQQKPFDLLYGDCWLIDKHGNIGKRLKSYYTTAKIHAWGIILMYQPSCFWSKAIYEKIGGLNPEFIVAMDGDLFYRMLKNTKNIVRTNHILSMFRIHENQSGSWAPKGRYQYERKLLKEREKSVLLNSLIYKIFVRLRGYLYRFLNIR